MCDSVRCNRYLEIMIVYDRQWMCVIPDPGCLHTGDCGKLAYVGFMPAKLHVCQSALWVRAWLYLMSVPFLRARLLRWSSFLCTFWMSTSKNICCCKCELCCSIPSVVCALNWWTMFPFRCPDVPASLCWVLSVLLIYINSKKRLKLQKEKCNWHPAEHCHLCLGISYSSLFCGTCLSPRLQGFQSKFNRSDCNG